LPLPVAATALLTNMDARMVVKSIDFVNISMKIAAHFLVKTWGPIRLNISLDT
jgi:hypothetical protein